MGKPDEYVDLLSLLYRLYQMLRAAGGGHGWLNDCSSLYLKMVVHGSTIYHLSSGTRFPVPVISGGTNFLDFASAAVLVRTLLDTYLTMFETFIEPQNDDLRLFRHNRWILSGITIRERTHLRDDDELKASYPQTQHVIELLRQQMRSTNAYQQLTVAQRKQVELGKNVPPRPWMELAKAAGFGPQTTDLVRDLFSGFVHADSLSGLQIQEGNTSEYQRAQFDSYMHVAQMIMGRAIMNMATAFKTAQELCEQSPVAFVRAEVFSKVGSRVP